MTSCMNLKKRLLLIAAVFLFIPSISGANAQTSEPGANGEAAHKRRRPAASAGKVEVVWQGRKFRRGDRVRVTSWAGTIKPDESGHPAELNADAGRTGTVIRGAKRQATSYFRPDPDEPIQILLVKWDRQTWTENGTAKRVALGAFESTIHADYLKVIKTSKAR